MFKKFIEFLKYNNLTVLIILVVFLLTTGVFAQTEAGQEFIGEKETRVEGTDNTLLLEADLSNIDMDYKIERIEEDEKYYYVTYTYLDLIEKDNAWQYLIQENVRKVSKKVKKDLGSYLAEELREEYEKRVSDLKKEQERELMAGEKVRTEIEEYTGIIGQTLDVVANVFEGYEAVKTRQIPQPTIPPTILAQRAASETGENVGTADNLTDVYNDYITRKDPDGDDVFGVMDNCPNDYNPGQLDGDDDGIGDVCDFDEELGDTNTVSSSDTDTSSSTEGTDTEPDTGDGTETGDIGDGTEVGVDDGNTPPATADPSQEGNVESEIGTEGTGSEDTSTENTSPSTEEPGSEEDSTPPAEEEPAPTPEEEIPPAEEPDVVIVDL